MWAVKHLVCPMRTNNRASVPISDWAFYTVSLMFSTLDSNFLNEPVMNLAVCIFMCAIIHMFLHINLAVQYVGSFICYWKIFDQRVISALELFLGHLFSLCFIIWSYLSHCILSLFFIRSPDFHIVCDEWFLSWIGSAVWPSPWYEVYESTTYSRCKWFVWVSESGLWYNLQLQHTVWSELCDATGACHKSIGLFVEICIYRESDMWIIHQSYQLSQ